MLELIVVFVFILCVLALNQCDPEHESCKPDVPVDHQLKFNWEVNDDN